MSLIDFYRPIQSSASLKSFPLDDPGMLQHHLLRYLEALILWSRHETTNEPGQLSEALERERELLLRVVTGSERERSRPLGYSLENVAQELRWLFGLASEGLPGWALTLISFTRALGLLELEILELVKSGKAERVQDLIHGEAGATKLVCAFFRILCGEVNVGYNMRVRPAGRF